MRSCFIWKSCRWLRPPSSAPRSPGSVTTPFPLYFPLCTGQSEPAHTEAPPPEEEDVNPPPADDKLPGFVFLDGDADWLDDFTH